MEQIKPLEKPPVFQTELNLDDDNRVRLPAIYHNFLETDKLMTVCRGLDNELTLYLLPQETWQKFAAKMMKDVVLEDRDDRARQRIFFGGSYATPVDKQGRIVLPRAPFDFPEGEKLTFVWEMGNKCATITNRPPEATEVSEASGEDGLEAAPEFETTTQSTVNLPQLQAAAGKTTLRQSADQLG